MTRHTHTTAPTQYVEAAGIRFAYRRWGQDTGVPLLFLQHFRGGMDHWDPAVTDGFAATRPVVLFDNAGVAGSSGETPNTVEAMADQAADLIGVLGLSPVDVLGFSIGGYVAQTLALRHPAIVRRLVLVGTRPRGGEPSHDPKYGEYAGMTDPKSGEGPLEAFLYLFFSPSETSSGRREGLLGATSSAQEGRRSAEFAADDGSPVSGTHSVARSSRRAVRGTQ